MYQEGSSQNNFMSFEELKEKLFHEKEKIMIKYPRSELREICFLTNDSLDGNKLGRLLMDLGVSFTVEFYKRRVMIVRVTDKVKDLIEKFIEEENR
ncbi:MAG: hypothetical protein U5L10_01585 [Candidatus Moranbacteria bacterium]|nr:hypothetical protein [Candidatus Moranbacteria bacterium]